MTPPPQRDQRDGPDALGALERLYERKVITQEEGQTAARLITGDDTFVFPPPKPERKKEAPAEGPAQPERAAPAPAAEGATEQPAKEEPAKEEPAEEQVPAEKAVEAAAEPEEKAQTPPESPS